MKRFKFIGLLGLVLIFIGIFIQRQDAITSYVNFLLNKFKYVNTIEEKNEYYLDYNFKYVKNTNNFIPSNFQDIKNIYYTVLNSGVENFTFRCDKKYKNCLDDVDKLANSQNTLSDINNYVHPFNSFTHIETTYDNLGNVTLSIVKVYNKKQIELINNEIDKVYNEIVKDTFSPEQNIKNIHDYIINNTKYDTQRSDNNIITYKSDTAYGSLIEGYALCGGYTDSMMLFLEKFGVKNYKISSENHVWNYVYLDDSWYNLDLTWDDPVTSNGSNIIQYDYFLITSDELKTKDQTEHNYDIEQYNFIE